MGLFFVGGSELVRIIESSITGELWKPAYTLPSPLWDPQWDPGELVSFPSREPFPEVPLPRQLEVCGMSAGLGLHEDFVTWL